MSNKQFFVIQVSTFAGYRETLRFHTAEPLDLNSLPIEARNAFLFGVLEAHGMTQTIVDPAAPIILFGFATEPECKAYHDKIIREGNQKPGPSPRAPLIPNGGGSA